MEWVNLFGISFHGLEYSGLKLCVCTHMQAGTLEDLQDIFLRKINK